MMVGNLFIDSGNLEIQGIALTDRNKRIQDFITALNCIKEKNDVLYSVDLIVEVFSFGNLFDDFIFPSWESFQSNSKLSGISQTTFQLFYTSLYPLPNMVTTDPMDRTTFDNNFSGTHFGYTGFYRNGNIPKYVHCPTSHFDWYAEWLCLHQDEIIWDENKPWLPNTEKIEEILLSELKDENISLPEKLDENTVCNLFYEKIMRNKSGDEPEAYIKRIARQILKANFYREEKELTKSEKKSCGSKRLIYSIVNSAGNKQYISIDFKHGMFEYHDAKGVHLGEHRFNGKQNKNADVSHNLRCLS